MSLKIVQEPIYNQIDNTSSAFDNVVIRGVDELIAGSGNVVGFNQNSVYIEYNGNVAVDVVSTNTADTNSSGIGCKKIRVNGLFSDGGDSNKLKPRFAEFNMNGTTIVNTASAGTNSFSVVNSVEMISNGTGNCNQGDITVKKTATSSLMGFIKATYSKSHAFIYAVACQSTLLIKDIHISAFAQTACNLKIYTQHLNNGTRFLETQILITDATNHINHPVNLKVLANHSIYCEVIPLEAITGSNFITINASALLI